MAYWNGIYERKTVIWFMILIIRDESNPKATVFEQFWKIHICKIASVAKLYSGIRRYFSKQEICLFYLIAESRILQYCLCQQPCLSLMCVYYIPTVPNNYYESLFRSLPKNRIFLRYMKGWNELLREKCPNTDFFLDRNFPHSDWIRKDTKYLSVFSLNSGIYVPENTPYLDSFHAVIQ